MHALVVAQTCRAILNLSCAAGIVIAVLAGGGAAGGATYRLRSLVTRIVAGRPGSVTARRWTARVARRLSASTGLTGPVAVGLCAGAYAGTSRSATASGASGLRAGLAHSTSSRTVSGADVALVNALCTRCALATVIAGSVVAYAGATGRAIANLVACSGGASVTFAACGVTTDSRNTVAVLALVVRAGGTGVSVVDLGGARS